MPIRKKGKLPHKTVSMAYALEYGTDEIEIHVDAVGPGDRVLLVDDLIATGGTAIAAINLLRKIGAEVVAACFVIDLPEIGGAKRLRDLGVEVRTLMEFEDTKEWPEELQNVDLCQPFRHKPATRDGAPHLGALRVARHAGRVKVGSGIAARERASTFEGHSS